jgi:hypothetical protein
LRSRDEPQKDRFGSIATEMSYSRDVRFAPVSDH